MLKGTAIAVPFVAGARDIVLPKRKSIRLEGYDYSNNGAYFITMCTKDMKCVLSKIVGDGALDVPLLSLSDCGWIVDNEIRKMNETYNNVKITDYVIMPNHVHMLIIVHSDSFGGTAPSTSPTNSVIAGYIGTLKRFTNKNSRSNLWQRSYYDHIIRDEADYIAHLQYIEENPHKWLLGKDEYYE